jgi:mannose-1-phosphate guanylyltransferase
MRADASGNVPAEDVLYVDARDCFVHRVGRAGKAPRSERRLYAMVGTEGLIVVETRDAVLITRKGTGETLRDVVRRLAAAGRQDLV